MVCASGMALRSIGENGGIGGHRNKSGGVSMTAKRALIT